MIISFPRKLILLSSFSFIGINCLPAFAEFDDQSLSQIPYDSSNSKEPWKINPQHWPPEVFCPVSPYHNIEPARSLKVGHTVVRSTSPSSDSIDISTRVIEATDISQPTSFPPFPTTIDLPVKLNHNKSTKTYRSTYIPGDTRSDNNDHNAITKGSLIEHNNEAVKLGLEGNWAEAIKEHILVLKAEPRNSAYKTNLSACELKYAEQLEKEGKLLEAAKYYRNALYTDRLNASADKALDNCLQAMGINHADPKTCQDLAEKLVAEGDIEGAIVEYRKLVSIEDSGRVHSALGFLLLKANKINDGYLELKIAVERLDWKPEKYKDLAECHLQIATLLQKYSRIAENSGRETTSMQRLLNAWIEYKRALFLDPTNQECVTQLILLSNEAINIVPASYNNWLALGSFSLLNNDIDKAEECYAKCTALDPNNSSLIKANLALKSARKANKVKSGLIK